MPTCVETCKTGITVGGIVGGLTGFALDVWVSIVYIRPFINHVSHTSNQNEEIITGTLALLALPFFVAPAMMVGKIAGPPTALALQGLYECGSSSLSALSKISLFHHKNNPQEPNELVPQDLDDAGRATLLMSPESMV